VQSTRHPQALEHTERLRRSRAEPRLHLRMIAICSRIARMKSCVDTRIAPGVTSRRMLTRFGQCVIAFTLCASIGGHWLGLQSIAWATMVVKYSQHCSFAQAIAQTFDGEHPCDLCKHISKARSSEKKQDSQSSVAKMDLICTIRRVVLLPPFAPFDYPQLISSSTCGSREPPSPPPRSQLA